MARIFTYDQDPSLNLNDKLIGTNSEDNTTKNFTVDSLLELANNVNAIKHFDGIVFKAQDYNVDSDQYGIITNTTGTYSSTDFNGITQIYLSKKNLKNSNVAEYIDVLAGYDIRITNKNDVNNFGIYRVDSISDYGTYKLLILTNQDASGQLQKGVEYYVSTLGNNLKNLNSFSVTSLNDVTSAGSGQIITSEERILFNTVTEKVNVSDVQNNLTSSSDDDESKPLSAYQGYILKGYIDSINALLASDNVDLDTLQEVVDFIEANKSTLDSLAISNIAGLQVALDGKVDVIVGKSLSTEDFTTALKTKLEGIADAAEVNVKADWGESNSALDSFILNKPTDVTDLSLHNVAELADVTSVGSGAIITTDERNKLGGIAAGAEVNVQADWNETNNLSDSYIQNKPSVVAGSTTIAINGTTNEVEVTGGTQDLSTNRSWTVGLPNDVTIGNNLTVTNSIGGASASITGQLDAASVDAGDRLILSTASASDPAEDNAIYFKTENSHDTMYFRYHGHTLKIDTLTEVIPSGITSGGILSAANTTQFTITAGTGIINDLNKESGATEPYPEIQYISWSQQTITVSNLDSGSTQQKNSWIYIDETGTVQQQATAFTDAQIANKIIIGSVVHSSGTIDFVKTFPMTAYAATAQLAEFARMFGPMKKTGHLITPNGANLSIDRAAGTAFAFGRNYSIDPNAPSIVTDNAKTICKIHRYYSDGSGGHVKDTNAGAGYNTLDPTKYDASGTLTSMNTAKFSVQRLYFFPTTPDVVVSYYGKGSYNSIDEAEKSYLVEQFNEADNTASQAIYLGSIILKGDATALNNAGQAKILTAGIFRSLAAVNIGGTAAAQALIDLTDVDTSGVADDYILRYDSSSGQFLAEALNTDVVAEGSTNLYDKTVTLTEGDNITITGTYPDFTIASAHPTITGAASDSTNTGSTFIQSLGFDSNGHVTSVSTSTFPSDINTTYTIGVEAGATNTSVIRLTGSDATTDDITIAGGSNVTVTEVGDTITIASSHPIIPTTGGVDNSGYTYIQDITLDSNGHVTAIGSSTISTAAVSSGSASLVTGDDVYSYIAGLGYSTTTGTVDTANSPGANEFARFTDSNTIEGLTASELKAALDLEIGTDIQAYDADLSTIGGLAKTDGNFIVGNGSTWVVESGNTARTSLGLGSGNNVTFNDLTVSGNLLVNGSTTTLNTATLTVNDLNITVADGATSASAADGAGITVAGANATITYASSGDKWVFNKAPYYNTSRLLTTADEGSGNGIDSDTLDGQHGSYYLDYQNFSGTPTINNATITIAAGSGLTGGGLFTGNQLANGTITLNHQDTSSQGSVNNSGRTYIQDITLDTYGHVTGISSATETVVDTNTPNFYIQAPSGTPNQTVNSNDILVFTGSGATTVSSSGTTTKTITISSTNTTYSASGDYGLTMSGTQFRLEDDRRRNSSTTDIYSGNTHDYTFYDASEGIRWYTEGVEEMRLTNGGDLHVDGDVIAYSGTVSDQRLKDNIVTIDNALEKVESLRGVSYTWNQGSRKGKNEIGVIAQEVEKVFPEIVHEKELPFIDGGEYKVVDYEKLTGVLIEAVKELSAEVKALKQQING